MNEKEISEIKRRFRAQRSSINHIRGCCVSSEGEILADGENVWENPAAKARIFYLSDDHFFFPHSTIRENAAYLSSVYPRFDRKRAEELAGQFGLPSARKINTFSKGAFSRT